MGAAYQGTGTTQYAAAILLQIPGFFFDEPKVYTTYQKPGI
jgi:hypothetical protein